MLVTHQKTIHSPCRVLPVHRLKYLNKSQCDVTDVVDHEPGLLALSTDTRVFLVEADTTYHGLILLVSRDLQNKFCQSR